MISGRHLLLPVGDLRWHSLNKGLRQLVNVICKLDLVQVGQGHILLPRWAIVKQFLVAQEWLEVSELSRLRATTNLWF